MNTIRGHVSLSHVTVGLKVVLGVKKFTLRHVLIQVGYPPSLPRIMLLVLIFLHFLYVGSRWSWSTVVCKLADFVVLCIHEWTQKFLVFPGRQKIFKKKLKNKKPTRFFPATALGWVVANL